MWREKVKWQIIVKQKSDKQSEVNQTRVIKWRENWNDKMERGSEMRIDQKNVNEKWCEWKEKVDQKSN